ncbi:hypothetical protein NBRC116594_14390 [Shimia sp. NS0008-38b]|uniref:ferredoxin n=1 Tax=Shimia sp. NS0008-38b TaxID=3127653 RepID=UPI003104D284
MSVAALQTAAQHAGLLTMGALHLSAEAQTETTSGTLVLLGTGRDFWPTFTAAPEYLDGKPHPIDRWSKRVIGALAKAFDGDCQFPSDGPPYPPFIAWALKSGRFFQSPVGMLVHDTVGLMISMRGAVLIEDTLTLPSPPLSRSPCDTCAAPCTSACPVGALSATNAYDVAACHSFLDTPDGDACMSHGCHVRQICPLSNGAHRPAAQSALHMKAFHP